MHVPSLLRNAVFAVAVELCGVSGLAFALGMYLPMDLNSPLVVGAAVAWLLRRSSKDRAVNTARLDQGTLIASTISLCSTTISNLYPTSTFTVS